MQWENTSEKSTTSGSGIHAIDTFIVVETKLVAISRRLVSLELKDKAQVNQVSSPTCTKCQAPTHITEECPLLRNQVGQAFEQVIVLLETKEWPLCSNLQSGLEKSS